MTQDKKDFLSMADLNAAEIERLLAVAAGLKARRRPEKLLAGKTLGMILEKPSTRTSVSFAVGMFELGGHVLTLNAHDLQIRRGESMADTARTLSRYLSGLMMRAHRHEDVLELAKYSCIPVINGLTDQEHPCQVLADLMTAMEVFKLKRARELKKLAVAYVGDGNNMAHSWMLAAAILGIDLRVATPAAYAPDAGFQARARSLAGDSGARLTFVEDPRAAVQGADVVYTDVWTSMGREEESDRRRAAFKGYQVNDALMKLAAPRAVAMHCLPAHRDEEITAAVLDGPRAVVFQQAENRLHVQKAVLLGCLGGGKAR